MSKLLWHVSVIKFKAQICWSVEQSAPLNMRTRRLPVTCQLYHPLHVRDCLINKNGKRPRADGEKTTWREASKNEGWCRPWSCELTYQAGGMFLPHTLAKRQPNHFSSKNNISLIVNLFIILLFSFAKDTKCLDSSCFFRCIIALKLKYTK